MLNMVGLVVEAKTGKPIEGARVQVIRATKPFAELNSDVAGGVKREVEGVKVGDSYTYNIIVELIQTPIDKNCSCSVLSSVPE